MQPLQRKLYAHIRTFVPEASIESIRFRSIAFATPTSHIAEDAEEADSEEANRREKREKERAAAWREEQEQEDAAGLGRAAAKRGGQVPRQEDEETLKSQGRVFFQPGEKRKVAFIKREVSCFSGRCMANTRSCRVVSRASNVDQCVSRLWPPGAGQVQECSTDPGSVRGR